MLPTLHVLTQMLCQAPWYLEIATRHDVLALPRSTVFEGGNAGLPGRYASREPLKVAAAFRSAKACLGHPGGGSRRALAPSSPASLAELVRSEMNPIPLVDESRLVALVSDFTTTSRRWDERAACADLPSGVDTYFPDDGELPPADALARCGRAPWPRSA